MEVAEYTGATRNQSLWRQGEAGGDGARGEKQARAGWGGSRGLLHPRGEKRGLEGGGQPRSMAGYLRRPGGNKLAFEEAHGGHEEGSGVRGERSDPVRADRVISQYMAVKMAAAIEAGSRGEEGRTRVARPEAQTLETPVAQAEQPMNRKRLVETLTRQVEAAKRRRNEEAP